MCNSNGSKASDEEKQRMETIIRSRGVVRTRSMEARWEKALAEMRAARTAII